MKVISLEQGTAEWLKWREEGVTATDAAVILGRSPYKTPWRLWAEKTHLIKTPDLSKNHFVAYGHQHEQDARRLYEEKTGDVLLALCGQYDIDETFKASFDGIDSDGCPVELKCPSESVLADVRENGVLSQAYQLYYIQVQHQCLVAGADHGHLVFWDGEKNDLIVFRIERNQRLIDQILTQGREFWHKVSHKIAIARDPERDLFIPRGEESAQWMQAADVILRYEAEIQDSEERINRAMEAMKEAKALIVQLMGEESMADYGGLTVKRSECSGRIDYQKMAVHLLGHEPSEEELKPFRQESKVRWLIRRSNGASVLQESSDEYKTMREHASHVPREVWF